MSQKTVVAHFLEQCHITLSKNCENS